MPCKDRKKYLEYQKAYYRKRKLLEYSINPAQANPRSSSGTISEATRRHVEELRKQGWEIDDVGNARRRA